MLLPWLLFLLVCNCTGLPIPAPEAGDFSSLSSQVGQVGGEAGVAQWPPSLPRVMSALPEEQVISAAPVLQEESTWDRQGENQALESYPGQLQTSYPGQLQTYPGEAYFTLPGQLHSHQNYQHSHHGHQHRHRHGPHGGIQFDTQQQQQQHHQQQQQYHQVQQQQQQWQHQQQQQWQQQEETENDADTKNQEVLLGLESGSVPSRFEEDEDGGEHRVYQRHLGYQTLHGFQGNSPIRQGNQDGVWYRQDGNNFAKSEDNTFQHDHRAHVVNGHQGYHYGYQQPSYSNVRSYQAQQSGHHQALNSWSLPHQYHQQSTYNAFLPQTNSRFPQAASTLDPFTATNSVDGSSEEDEENDDNGLWSRGASWISQLWPKAQEWGDEPTVEE